VKKRSADYALEDLITDSENLPGNMGEVEDIVPLLEAKGEVISEAGILNSAINTQKQITMGKKGIIIGGKLCSQDGVTAAQIGSRMSPRTEFYCGVE